MAPRTTRIITCPHCGYPVLEGHSCRCRRDQLTATRPSYTEPLTVDAKFRGPLASDSGPRATPRGSVLTRARAVRAAVVLPALTAFLIWSALTPAFMVRAAGLAVSCALLILLALPADHSRGD